jgi:hypothetical protein
MFNHCVDIEHPNSLFSFEKLSHIEKTRRSLLIRSKRFGRLNILCSFTGTILPNILLSRQAWFTAILYVFLRLLLVNKIVEVGDTLPQINSTIMSIIGGFVSFFLVFFLSQAYSRYTQQYDLSMRMEGRIFNLCYLARSALSPHEAWRLIRYINAIHVLGYVGLSTIYKEENLFSILNQEFRLLNDLETSRLQSIGMNNGGNAYREVLCWTVDLIYEYYRLNNPFANFSSYSPMYSLPAGSSGITSNNVPTTLSTSQSNLPQLLQQHVHQSQ